MYSKYVRFSGKFGRSKIRTVIGFKYITSKLSEKASNTIKHRDTSKWANLKRLLLDTFESRNTAANSLLAFEFDKNAWRRKNVSSCWNRVEELFFKPCNASGTGRESGKYAEVIRDTQNWPPGGDCERSGFSWHFFASLPPPSVLPTGPPPKVSVRDGRKSSPTRRSRC